MKIDICETDDGENVINKKLVTIMEDVEVKLKTDSTNLDNPVFLMHSDTIPRCDYIVGKDGAFKYRKFFIREKNLLPNSMVEFVCHVDVLDSFWNSFKKEKCLITRQENIFSPYFPDTEIPCEGDKQIETITVGAIGGDYKYYLTVAGGIN